MDAIAAWLQVFRGAGWFYQPLDLRLPIPATWHGWLAFAILIVVIAMSAVAPRELGPIAVGAALVYVALSFWTLEKAD